MRDYTTDRAFADSVWAKLRDKAVVALEMAKRTDGIPYIAKPGAWQADESEGVSWWTNGFWPALMWQYYLATGRPEYRAEAERAEKRLDEALYNIDCLHHDVGFMWNLSSGVNYRLTGNDESRKRLMLAATILAGRCNPAGFIRAWNGERVGWAIIDTMMNLPLLYRASEMTGDPRFRKVAMLHADTALKQFLRPDGSANHIVIFDPETGDALETPAGQGYAPGSSWSRGQAWALYGFLLSWLHTGETRYLDASRASAAYFLSRLSEDGIPDCDFAQPNEPYLKDNCAGAIAACGLLRLSQAEPLPEAERERFREGALRLLRAMDENCADWTDATPGILQMCTSAYHGGQHHVNMVYGDYFFVEAMNFLRGEKTLFW